MIPIASLKYFSSQMHHDATILFKAKRFSGAIYLIGHALESAFKRKICQTLGFRAGFPESNIDFHVYRPQINSFNVIEIGVVLN